MVLTELLDKSHTKLLDGDTEGGIDDLRTALYKLRSSMPLFAWEEQISICRNHPICKILHEDPLTHRSFTKPRGYAGDAVMLDLIYDVETYELRCSELGKAVFRCTAGSGRSPQAVRNRRSLIAKTVDEISGRVRPRILSIGSGHLREAELSIAFNNGRIEEWVAIDQDDHSLAECALRYSGSVIRPLKGSVRNLLSGKLDLDDFDFVYSAGLFDYLRPPVAVALLSRMFQMLKPNGTLLVANFAAGHLDTGYMEAFMDWRLTYRGTQDMDSLLGVLKLNGRGTVQVYTDAWNAIIYGSVEKGGA